MINPEGIWVRIARNSIRGRLEGSNLRIAGFFSLIVRILDFILGYVSDLNAIIALRLMTPEEWFTAKVNELIQSGCSMEDALQMAREEFNRRADLADQLLRQKIKTENDMFD